jgi:hypothetical protein
MNIVHEHGKPQVNPALNSVDCLHCCHCHSTQPVYLEPVYSDFCLAKVGPPPAYKLPEHRAPFLCILLRPPIS